MLTLILISTTRTDSKPDEVSAEKEATSHASPPVSFCPVAAKPPRTNTTSSSTNANAAPAVTVQVRLAVCVRCLVLLVQGEPGEAVAAFSLLRGERVASLAQGQTGTLQVLGSSYAAFIHRACCLFLCSLNDVSGVLWRSYDGVVFLMGK